MAKKSSSHFQEKNLHVLLDMDMVLCDFESRLLQLFRENHPDEPFIPIEDREGFYARDQYGKLRADLSDKVRAVHDQEGFILSLPEIPGALDAAREMSQMESVDVFICTSPLSTYKHCLQEKFQWVENHLGPDWIDRLILTKDKTMVFGHILIDDKPVIKGVVKRPSWEHIVFSACHNRHTNLKGKKRLENWTDGSWRELIADWKMRI